MRPVRRLISLLWVSILATSSGWAAPPPPAPPHPPLPQGFADADGRIGYVASAAGGIEALDLASGKVLWQTTEAQQPLRIDGDHLLAQAGVKRNRLRILRFDLKRDGECDLESDPIVFPPWVITGEAAGRSFSAEWRVEAHRLILDWEASAWYVGASRPSKEEAEAARKHADGQVFVDLLTGKIDMRPAEKKPTPPTPPTPPDHLERKALRWQGRVGLCCKALALEEEEGRQRFVLHTWIPGSELTAKPKELLAGRHLLARAALDESVLFLRETSTDPDDRASLMPKKPPTPWHLFSTATGKPLGRIPYEAGMHALAVVGKRVFYLTPGPMHGSLERGSMQEQTLRVRDLTGGKKLWERPVAGTLIAPPPL